MTGVPMTCFPDPAIASAAEKISGILREHDLGGAMILVSQQNGGMMVVEPVGWYPKGTCEITPEQKLKFGHFMTCMHEISSTMHNMYHTALEGFGVFGKLKDAVWN